MAVEVGRPLNMAGNLSRQSKPAVPISSCADFRFNPPEYRLILEYLRPFALGRITGAESVINDDPYRAEPRELLDEHRRGREEGAFFFARKTMVGARRSRTVGESGTWRTQTSEKRPAVDAAGRVVAMFRKTLLSYYTAGNRTTSTGYVMYEYELFVGGCDESGGGGTYDAVLCHIRKSCREAARSNKRKRQLNLQAAIAAASAAASFTSGCTSRSAADGNPDSPTSPSGLLESRAERIPTKPVCEAPVIVDDTDANPNSMVSPSRQTELKASIGEARKIFVPKPVTGAVEITGGNSATSLAGTPKSKAFPETPSENPAVINCCTNAKPDSMICLSERPESTALLESAHKSPTVANQYSASSLSELPELRSLRESACEAPVSANPESTNVHSGPPRPRAIHEPPSKATMSIAATDLSPSKLRIMSQPAYGSEDAANNFTPTPDASLLLLPARASSDSAETPSEDWPWQEEPTSDSSDKSKPSYNVGELIDIVETENPAAARIREHSLWELLMLSDTIVIEELIR